MKEARAAKLAAAEIEKQSDKKDQLISSLGTEKKDLIEDSV